MSAIKLPVKAEPDRDGRWKVSDGQGNPVAMYLSGDHAVEIERKLNLHGALAKAVGLARDYSRSRNDPDCEPWRSIRLIAARAEAGETKI